MKTLRPSELEIEGFRSFKDRALIKFPDSGMMLINGKYTDGSMSSGSGKSSVQMAIAFALNFCPLPATLLKNWDSKKIFVRLRLTDGDNTIDVIRDPKLKLIENGKEYNGLSKGAEERLAEWLRTPASLLSALTYRQQRERGVFLNATDADKKEFLSTLLGLSQLESASESLWSELKQAQLKVDHLKSSISTEEARLATLSDIDSELDKANQTLAEISARHESLTNTSNIESINTEISQLKAEINNSNIIIRQSLLCEQDNASLRSSLADIAKEEEIIKNNICPTCKREWDKGQARLKELSTIKDNIMVKARSNVSVIKSAEPISKALPGLQARLEVLQAELNQKVAPLADVRRSLSTVQLLVANLIKQKSHKKAMEATIAEEKQKLTGLVQSNQVLSHACEILSKDGFLSVIFDEVLKEIETRANAMLGCIHNVNTLSISVSSLATTKTGNVKKSINVKVHKNGEELPVKALSGGQQCSLELCLDLAVSETIRARSGSPIGWICLDEAMDGLDTENKQSALEMIRKKATGLVIVIDHSTEIKEGFEKILTIECDGKRSYLL